MAGDYSATANLQRWRDQPEAARESIGGVIQDMVKEGIQEAAQCRNKTDAWLWDLFEGLKSAHQTVDDGACDINAQIEEQEWMGDDE